MGDRSNKNNCKDFIEHYEKRVDKVQLKERKPLFFLVIDKLLLNYLRHNFTAPIGITKIGDGIMVLDEKEEKKIKPIEKIKMVMTRDKDDDEELWEKLGNKEFRSDLDIEFKNEKSNFKIAIVVDMWTTGFDVPCLDSIYIDKPIQKHNLIQTISRVNRRFENKQKGLVVDYIGIKKHMNLALSVYTGEQGENLEDIKKSVIIVKEHLNLLEGLLSGIDKSKYFKGSPLDQLRCLNIAADFVLSDKKLERTFMDLTKRLKFAFDICSGSADITYSEKDKIYFYLAIKSIVFKVSSGGAPDLDQMNKKVKSLVEDALKSDGVQEVFKLNKEKNNEIDIFDSEYLNTIEKVKQPNTKLELLQQILRKTIGEFKKINKVKGIDFSKKMNNLVEKYNERDESNVLRSEVVKDFTQEIINLYSQLTDEINSLKESDIDFEEKAFFDILFSLTQKYNFLFPEKKLIELSKEVKKIIDSKSNYPDWFNRDDIKAELQFDLILLLDKWGYPPIDRDEVYREILDQAINFKKYKFKI